MSTTQPDATAGTQNVLEMMTAGIMGRKSTAAAKLTPVSSEVATIHVVPGVIPDKAPAPFPSDHPREVILDAIAGLRVQRDKLDEVIAALEALAGVEADVVAPDPEAARKQAEREADVRASGLTVIDGGGMVGSETLDAYGQETYDEDQGEASVIADLSSSHAVTTKTIKQLEQEAQAAVYGPGGTLHPTAAAPAPTGWSCPTHGAATTAVRKSRLGREYRACSECKEFEKLT